MSWPLLQLWQLPPVCNVLPPRKFKVANAQIAYGGSRSQSSKFANLQAFSMFSRSSALRRNISAHGFCFRSMWSLLPGHLSCSCQLFSDKTFLFKTFGFETFSFKALGFQLGNLTPRTWVALISAKTQNAETI